MVLSSVAVYELKHLLVAQCSHHEKVSTEFGNLVYCLSIVAKNWRDVESELWCQLQREFKGMSQVFGMDQCGETSFLILWLCVEDRKC